MKERVTLKQLSLRSKIMLSFIGVLGGSGGILAGVAALIELFKN